jgi:DNA-binding CsgD family transcriptional regulator
LTTGHDLLYDWNAAYNARDLRQLVALSHPAIEIVPVRDAVTAPPGIVYRGHAGLRTLLSAGYTHYTELRADPGRVEVVGRAMVASLTFTMRSPELGTVSRTMGVVYEHLAGLMKRIEAFAEVGDAYDAATRRSTTLSDREIEILALAAAGQTAREIADDLVISPHTVRTHLRTVKAKLSARTLAEAVAIAARRGLLED